jgi:flagellar M-ring protein FliF
MNALRAFLNQLATFWKGLSTPKRIALVSLTTLALAVILLVSYVGNRKNYGYLYTNLEPADASAVVEKLKATQVPYRLDADGRGILVPEERIAPLRLELASAGLPRGGGIGFELFDKNQLGATEFEQQVSLRRALEGELTRSILTIDGVKSARVHLVMPQRSLFVVKEAQPSASVVLKLTNSESFGKREVAGIVHLVSAAVPGLRRDRVSVVSTDGLTLHRPNTGDSSFESGEADDMASERALAVASQLEAAARSQLERVVGAGNAEVRIAVDLDTSAKEKVEEHYEPSKTALRSENRTEERSGTGAPGVAGVPGAMTNLPDAQQPGAEATEAPGGPNGAVGRLSQTRNWEVDKVSQKTTTPPGEVERLSISVLLNDKIERRGAQTISTPRSPQEIAKLEELIKRTVGFNLERGDSLRVDSAPFIKSDLAESEASAPVPVWRRYLPYILAALLIVVIAVTVLVWRKKQAIAKEKANAAARTTIQQLAHGQLIGDNVGELPPGTAVPALGEGASNTQLPDSHLLDAPARRARALQVAAEDPATAAIVIRKWLNATNQTGASARI